MRFSASFHWSHRLSSSLFFISFSVSCLSFAKPYFHAFFRAVATTLTMTANVFPSLALRSSKLLGFICELVESSQTVQQHMIQVRKGYNSISNWLNSEFTFGTDTNWMKYISHFVESRIFSDIIHVATLVPRSSHIGCAGLISESHQVLGHLFVGKQWSAVETGKCKCVPWTRNPYIWRTLESGWEQHNFVKQIQIVVQIVDASESPLHSQFICKHCWSASR